ncbi:uncharacterized protein LY89DRAFT_130574 [Mollisia scopiformis]|uniref:Uncharacterized protein n=1 Tax=Mollisia scopiformis TaxID=149040 RepID=A0A194X1S4_MOLSC|nr:uncharacterized protein LY89DRAFT_130574 [Mollisia scopiformis]KUJ14148.1 hypothetical protein LY89DRAFT_130574 [Mollisia scopiformis]
MKLLRSELEGGREERREIMKLLRSELEGAREERELHAVMELLRPELEGGRKERLRFVFIIALLVLLLSLLPGRTEYLH